MEPNTEALYRALFETTLDGIMIVDDGGRYVEVNDSLCQLLKAPRERLIGAHFTEFIPPSWLERASAGFRELNESGRFTGEFPMQALDGRLVELEWTSRANVLPGLHFWVARDITARKQAERELWRQQEELTDFIENATVGLHWVGPDGIVLWANRAELELLGYTQEEYIGHHIAEFHADPPVIEDILRRLAAKEELHSYEARLRCKDGSIRHVLISSNVRWNGDRFLHTRCFTRDITERKRAEESLKLHARVLESMTEGVSIADENGIIRYTNPAEGQMFGYGPGELIGQPVTLQNNYPPEENARIVGEVIEDLRAHGAWTGEWENRKKDGTPFVTFARITALEVDGQRYFVCVREDVTDRKQAEQALRESEALYRTLGEAVPDFVWACGAEGEPLYVNQRWSDYTGLTRDEPSSLPMDVLHHPEDYRRLVEVWSAAARKGEPYEVEYRLRRHDGAYRWIMTRAVPLKDDAGRILQWIGTSTDIHERKEAEQALSAERERLLVTLASIGDAVIVTNAEGRPTFMNPVAEALTGWTQSDAQGRALDEVFRIVNEETRNSVESPVARVLREGAVVGLANHTVLVARDGSEHGIDDSAAPIFDEQRVIQGVVLVFRDVTERRRAEETRMRLAAIVESSNVAIFSKNMEGIVTSWNRAAEELYGYSAEEMVGGSITRIIPADHPDEFPALMGRLRRGERIEQYETVRVRKDGKLIDVLVNISPLRSHSGEVTGASIVTRDITAEKRLRREQSFLVQLNDALRPLADPQAIMATAARLLGEALGVSRCAYAEVEEDEDQFVVYGDYTRDCASIVGRHRLAAFGSRALADLRAGRTYRADDIDQEAPPGADLTAYRLTQIRAVVSVPLIKEGRLVGGIAVHQDQPRRWTEAEVELVERVAERLWALIARARADNRERAIASRLGLALSAARLGDWNWEAASGLVNLSERAAEIFGIPPGPTMSWRQMRTLLHEEDQERARLAVETALAEHGDYDIEYRVGRPEGGWRWVSAKGRGVYAPDGAAEGMIGVVQDITERKNLEAELRQRAEELAAADRRKDDFLAMLAHELRNPLAPVRNALHLLHLQAGDAAAVDRWRGMMERQVGHMTRLVDDLLDVSRINRGKISLRPERLDLRRLIEHSISDHHRAMEDAGLSVEVRLPDTPVWVMGDATRLTQVLDNLLENARKFTERVGRIEVELTMAQAEQQAVITVADTGIGIEAEMLPRLFDVFSQADRSLDRSRGGLGLGLALVKGLMELHHGSVEARSAGVGRGAAFVLRLPLEPEPQALIEDRKPALTPAGNLRILIVEDNRDAAESLRELMEVYGYQVQVSHTGPEGVKAAEAERPDVIICDIGLPGMDGYSVVQALRENSRLSGTRYIALSGYGQETEMERSRRAGFDEHLVKPVDPNRLLSLLRSH